MNAVIKQIFFIILLFAGCSSVSEQVRSNHEGNIALRNQNYTLAKDRFKNALKKAQAAGDQKYESIAMYGLGRAHGYLCEYEEAEKWFKKSIDRRKGLENSKRFYTTQNYLELARLFIASGNYDGVIAQFKKAIPQLISQNIEKTDPIGYANVLNDYVIALEKSGKSQEASEVKKEIENLRRDNPDKSAKFVAIPYPKSCKPLPLSGKGS